MGSHATTYALIALAIALVCILAGFLWGRANVKAQIEDALEKERGALASREFTIRQQADEAIAELSRLRPLAEELGRVQERLKQEQSRYAVMRAEFNSATGGAIEASAGQQSDEQLQEPASPAESADEAIQKLLQSLEELNSPIETSLLINEATPQPPVPQASAPAVQASAPIVHASAPAIQTSAPAIQASAPAIQTSAPAVIESRPAVPAVAVPAAVDTNPQAAPLPKARPGTPPPAQKRAAPPPSKTRPSKPAGAHSSPEDEWQEFARSLANLTGRKQ